MTEPNVVDILRAVSLADLAAMTDIPEDLRQKIADMMAAGVNSADVASMVDDAGYRVVIVPVEDDLEGDDMGEDMGEDCDDEEDDEVEIDVEVDGVEVEITIGDDDEEDDDDDEEEEEAGGLIGLLDRLRSVFGKAVSFESENKAIARNRKRAAAREAHPFVRAVWATRKGVVRCRVCGGPAPTDGEMCSGLAMAKDAYQMAPMMPAADDAEMGRDDDLGELTIRSAAFAEAVDLIVDALGCYSQRDAHYMGENPFLDEGLACVNCVAYCPEVGGCYWVEGSIAPEGLCKLWTIPEAERTSPVMAKSIVEVGGKFEVMSADGSKSFGTYDSRAEAEARLRQVEHFSKADTFTPPAGVRSEAAKAEKWIAEGHAGAGFTATGRRRASDLAAGKGVSLDTIKRISSYLARHETDKSGEGWSPGDPGFPSPGRVAWAAWGGDPAISWTDGILAGVEKAAPPMKTEGGEQYPAEAFAYVPDPEKPSTWKLRLWEDPSKKETVAQVSRAVSALSPAGFRGQKVDIPSGDLAGVKSRIRVAWKRVNGPDREVPSVLKDNPGTSDVHVDVPMGSDGRKRKPSMNGSVGIPSVFAKAEERRFTLGPWYVPDAYDAHGEWTDAEELQSALWGYVRSGDRSIRLQHNVDIVAGEWVEAMTWPYAVSVPMLDAVTGVVSEQEFPPETVYMGVVWEPWAWELVKEGKIRGYSMGGNGQRVTVDLPTEGSL